MHTSEGSFSHGVVSVRTKYLIVVPNGKDAPKRYVLEDRQRRSLHNASFVKLQIAQSECAYNAKYSRMFEHFLR